MITRLRHKLGFHKWNRTRAPLYTNDLVYDESCPACGAVRENWSGSYFPYIRKSWRDKPLVATPAEMRIVAALQAGGVTEEKLSAVRAYLTTRLSNTV